MPTKTLRESLIEAFDEDAKNEYSKQRDSATRSDERSTKLRKDVTKSSSESSRIYQTLGHLGGKAAGQVSDAAIREGENRKESMAEDEERNASLARARANAAILLLDMPPSKKLKK